MKTVGRWIRRGALMILTLGIVIGLYRVFGNGYVPTDPEFFPAAERNLIQFSEWLKHVVDGILNRK